MKHLSILLLLFVLSSAVPAQDCKTIIVIQLENSAGGFFANQTVTLTPKAGGKPFTAMSNGKGEARFDVPCNVVFDMTVSNYTKKIEMLSLDEANSELYQTLGYSADMIEKEKLLRMNDAEKAIVDKMSASLMDTFFFRGSSMTQPAQPEFYSRFAINLKDFDGKPLVGEMVTITGAKRNKSVKVISDNAGNVAVYVLKGDLYRVHFKYDKNYSSTESSYFKGTSTIDFALSYLGTKEIERRQKEEADRLIAEARRLKEEKDEFEKYCKKLGISLEEGYRRRSAEYLNSELPDDDTVVSAVLDRNKWSEKLIVCDLSGSMMAYSAQLSLWYRLNFMKEKNLQFIFFNDGDSLADEKKIIGSTGGIYYSSSKGIDSLNYFVSRVAAAGSGGDVAENNMEALIKGVKMAGPYKELVMIVDNRSPVKDIELLPKFNLPVHIIACGVSREVLADYLLIAWKTKGSIHTIGEDITAIAKMLEGETIVIGKTAYKLMNGRFVRISKI